MRREERRVNVKAAISIFFSPNRSTPSPAGIEKIPYARKIANGSRETRVRLKEKLWMMSGISGLMTFVINPIAK